jgi:hypothetical protein
MIVAFDLDGTLANIEHRLHLIHSKPSNWPAFFRACVDDEPNQAVIDVCRALVISGHAVDVWSGRSDIVRAESERWLNQYAIGYRRLLMRREGDYRPDQIVKAEWLEAMAPEDRPVLAFDDRQRVVDMWRAHGVQCCQVAPGDF